MGLKAAVTTITESGSRGSYEGNESRRIVEEADGIGEADGSVACSRSLAEYRGINEEDARVS